MGQGVNALATSSAQGPDADEDEAPKAKRQCGDGSTEAVDLERNTPAATKEEGSNGEGAADVKLRQGTSDIQASTEVAQSTNLKRARNVSCKANFFFCWNCCQLSDFSCSTCSWPSPWRAEPQLLLRN